MMVAICGCLDAGASHLQTLSAMNFMHFLSTLDSPSGVLACFSCLILMCPHSDCICPRLTSGSDCTPFGL